MTPPKPPTLPERIDALERRQRLMFRIIEANRHEWMREALCGEYQDEIDAFAADANETFPLPEWARPPANIEGTPPA